MTYGSDLKFFEKLREDGSPTPFDLYPELGIVEEWFLLTFSRLSATRSAGLSINPISFTEISQYFDLFPPPYDLEYVIDVIQKMDSAFLDFSRKKSKQQEGKGKTK